LSLKYGDPLSNFAFIFNLRHYKAETAKMMADAELVNAAVMAELEAELAAELELAEAEDDKAHEK